MLRRELLQASVLAGAANLLPCSIASSTAASEASRPVELPFRMLFDTRFADSREQALELLGALAPGRPASLLRPVDGNITSFWQQELSPAWREASPALAGVTGASVLFCLSQFARDKQLRVLWQHPLPSANNTETLLGWMIGSPDRSA